MQRCTTVIIGIGIRIGIGIKRRTRILGNHKFNIHTTFQPPSKTCDRQSRSDVDQIVLRLPFWWCWSQSTIRSKSNKKNIDTNYARATAPVSALDCQLSWMEFIASGHIWLCQLACWDWCCRCCNYALLLMWQLSAASTNSIHPCIGHAASDCQRKIWLNRSTVWCDGTWLFDGRSQSWENVYSNEIVRIYDRMGAHRVNTFSKNTVHVVHRAL